MIRVVVIGAGNVGSHLSDAFLKAKGINLVQTYGRTKSSLKHLNEKISTTTSFSELKDADIYIMAVPDDAIHKVSEQITNKHALIAHTSGGASIDLISSEKNKGVFYPLQTFSKSRKVEFSEIPICIEAEKDEHLVLLQSLANAISSNVTKINSAKRAKLHLAAVFVNNFVNHFYHISAEYLKENEISFDLLKPLIQETASKVNDLSPFEAQTGPAKRKDDSTIQNHLKLLENSTYKEMYNLMTQAIQTTHGKKL